MSIYETSVKKPITTALIFVAIAILGVFSLTRLSVDLMPETDTTNIMVVTTYPGASAQDIESNVSKLLENSLNSVDDLKHITSRSSENSSLISLKFNAGTDITEATNNVRDKLDAVRNRLPEGATNPMIFKFGTTDIPITILSVQSSESTRALDKLLEEKLTNRLARIEGVGSVSVVGTYKRTIQVYCDPIKLEAYHLTLGQISQMIAAENANIPAGQIDLGTKTNSLRVQGEFVDVEQLGSIVLSSIGGKSVYLRDVAKIVDGSSEHSQDLYVNGQRGATVVVNKQSGSNAVKIADLIRKELPLIQHELPSDVKIEYLMDTTTFITSSINSLSDTIVITFIIVMIVVYVFLARWKATLIVIITIPVSLVASFAYLLASGNTLNIISLSSLSIAIGMVVDDAIVVLENITSHIERGSYPKQAAIHATNEVGISVVASTLTMLAVFLPLTMIQGQSGLMFRQLGWIISIVMIVSTVAALSLTPMMSSQLLKRTQTKSAMQERLLGGFHRLLDKLDNFYASTLRWCVRHRKATIFSAMGVFVLSLGLLGFMKVDFMPSQDIGFVQATVELPVGTRQEVATELGHEIQRQWRERIPGVSIVSMTSGQADGSDAFSASQDNGSNVLGYRVSLAPRAERELSQDKIADEMRKILAEYPQIARSWVKSAEGGGGGSKTIDIDIFGYDFATTDQVAKELRDKIVESESCSEVHITRKDYTPELRFVFDRQRLADHGLNLSTAAAVLRGAVNGNITSKLREDGDEYDIRVSLEPQYRATLSDITSLIVYTPRGEAVRLGNLGHIEESFTPPTIERKDRSRVVTLQATIATGYAISDLNGHIQQVLSQTQMPSGVSYKVGGVVETQSETFGELYLLMVLIIILVFIVMAAQFESLTAPFVIMFAVPFAFTGVFIGLVVTQIPMGSMAMIGLIMLIGIVVKNGIVLIDYIRLCRERGLSIANSVITSGRSRLRPVLMTTLTTVLGMVPMAIGIGEGSEMWQSMGVTVAWGLSFSTLITLVLVPIIYTALEARILVLERKRQSKHLAQKALVKK